MVDERADRRHRRGLVPDSVQRCGYVPAELLVRLGTRYSAKIEELLSHLLEHPELAQQPPEQQEDDDGAEAPTAEFFCTVPGSEPA